LLYEDEMVFRIAFGSALLAAYALVGSPASGAPLASPEPVIAWDAPATCPVGSLLDRVASLVGLSRERLVDKLVRIDASVDHRSDGTWAARLAIETVAGSGERDFEAEDCRSLVEGTSLIVALAIDPTVQPTIQPTVETPRAPQPDTTAAQPSLATTAKRPDTTSEPVRFLLRPLLVADMGVLPDTGLGFGLAAGTTWRRLRFEIDGTGQAEQRLTDLQSPSRGGAVRPLLRSGARACVAVWQDRVEQDRVEIDGCLGAALSWMRATGQHISSPETNDALWVAVMAGAAASLHLYDRLWLRVEGHVGIGVRRPAYEIGPATEVYRSPALTERVGFGLEVRL
jgi:hypothetical protein